MGKAFVGIVVIVLAVYALFDVLAAPKFKVRYLPKWAWLVAVIVVPVVGPLLWIFVGSPRQAKPPTPGTGKPGPVGPDDDPDFLRGL